MSLIDLTSFFAASDEQIMGRVRSHDDADGYGRLVTKWQPAIQRLCVRMLGDAHRGEDLAQEAFVRLYAKRHEYQPTARFSTYLWRVALNLCYDELRRLKRRSETSLDTEGMRGEEGFSILDTQASLEPGPDEELAQSEQAALVRDALQKLPEHYRSVVVLRHYENLKFREIADVLEIPEGTVKSRMAEGLSILEEILTRALRSEAQPSAARRVQKESFVL
jgi:RNA polymerase sigma-70 factor (ECF subfamily)